MITSSYKSSHIILSNQKCRGVLQCFVFSSIKYDFVAITETWLDCSINTSEIFPDCFMVHRKDRSRHGGGVFLAHGVELSCIRREDFETNCELLCCEVTVCNPKKSMLVGVYYRPPASDIAYLDELAKSLSLIEESGNSLDILLLGDFNLPNISWSAINPYGNDITSSAFCDIIQDYFLYQLISEPTRDGDILDLVLANASELISGVQVCERLGNSDHDSVEFKIKPKFSKAKLGARVVYDYGKANWIGLKEDFERVPWDCIYLTSDIDDIWGSWKTLFFKTVEQNIPFKFLRQRGGTPWITLEIKKRIQKKRRLWKQAKLTGCPDKWLN